MAKILRCKHVGPDANCTFVAHGDTEEEILQRVAVHASEVHGYQTIPEKMIDDALKYIEEEAKPGEA